ncbi:MAG: ParB N-terminal domain-containing protein [Mycobacterium sp.]|nr:ParB N-terminal domain-containing protein [Mycobacterium sp.]
MTETTTTAHPDQAVDTGNDATSAQPTGALTHLPPHDLDLGLNVRDRVDLGKQFLASLREHGVIAPITAVRLDDGTVQVRDGQRRTLGAREVGLPTVPVYVVPANACDEAAHTVERIAHQIVANDHRDDLTDAQRARGIQQM